MTLDERLERIEGLLVDLMGRQQARQWYTVEEFARLVGRSEFTCREWCRNGRVSAEKKTSGRGAHAAWAISHFEYERFQREGLRPLDQNQPLSISPQRGVMAENNEQLS